MRPLRRIGSINPAAASSVIAVLATALGALALLPGAASASLPTGSISGTVTAAVGGAPLEGVEVCAFNESEEEETCQTTDAAGEYTIAQLAAGKYTVGFFPVAAGLDYVRQYYQGVTRFFEATPVSVGAGAKTGIDAQLHEGGEIHGKVVNATGGAALQGVEVCAFGFTAGASSGCTETDALGEYTLIGLGAGEYEVEFFAEGFLFQFFPGAVTVTTGARTPNIDAALSKAGAISGRVTDAATHAGLAEIPVCAFDIEEGEIENCEFTEPGGAYSLGSLPVDHYKVEFAVDFEEEEPSLYEPQFYSGKATLASANIVTVSAEATTSGIDAALVKKGVHTTPAPAMAALPPFQLNFVPSAKPRLPRCKKGFHRKTVKGQSRCVKVHHRHRSPASYSQAQMKEH